MRSLMSDGKKHEKSKSHLAAYKMWKMFGVNVGVDSLLSQARRDEIQRHNEEVRQNREILKTETEAVLYLSKQELAFRGHDEKEDSLNKGNYRELLESFAKFDSVFERRLHGRLAESGRGGRFTGVSPEIQNDLINCIDSVIDDVIMKEIDDCTFISVQVDETSDVSTKEQVSIIGRLDKGEIVERQLGFVDVSMNRTAPAISEVVKDKLGQFSTMKEKLIMQTYDGASVMSGHINGVQLWFVKICVFYKILEQSSILYSVLQSTGTDFSYGISKIESFKNFVSSLRTNEEFGKFYQEAVDKVGQPASKADKKHNYKALYFEIIDSIVGMLSERFQDMKQFEFLDLVNPKVFSTWNGVPPPEKITLLKEMYGSLFDLSMLQSQLSFIYNDKDFHKESSNEVLKYIFQFNLQSSLPEAVKLFKMNGVLAVSSASVERSFSCLKRVKGYLRNRMGQARLSSLCRISIHKDIIKLLEDDNTLHEHIIKKFVEKPRRLPFLFK
ncbi:uncharacterized protein LOC114525891 [Dendronephthya gigantea]|uniref:uncharacterized protein LOC114525891 n=1 Tax=Dendronephthya gigantea TaxID=151771 RepID=UPI00106B67C6|nr:uncharacterized protein LOC114525891 [Dendronephthya gigantea]